MGRDPPPDPEKEKPAGVAVSDGPIETGSYVASTKSDLPVKATRESKGKGKADWRSYYDNARGNVDEALKSLMQAWGAGLISDEDYTTYDSLLRCQQTMIAQKPSGPSQIAARQFGNGKSKLAHGWPRRRPRRMLDREKSRERARQLGGSSSMPPQLRARFTECERSVLTIVAIEVKRHGICDLSVGEIAARAGVCVRTVQNAVAEAMRQGCLMRQERPQLGRKNLTNMLRIVSAEWLAWIKRGPVGCKDFTATEIIDLKTTGARQLPRVSRILRVSG